MGDANRCPKRPERGPTHCLYDADHGDSCWFVTELSYPMFTDKRDWRRAQDRLDRTQVQLDRVLAGLHPDPNADDQAVFELSERLMTRFTETAERLARSLNGKPSVIPEAEQLRAVVEAMRPIVDAAIQWRKGTGLGHKALMTAVDINRKHLSEAMSKWTNSQTWSGEEKLRASLKRLIETAETVGHRRHDRGLRQMINASDLQDVLDDKQS